MKKWIFLIGLLFAAGSQAQTYSINWYKIDGGGGASTGASGGNTYSLTGSIGQHDAGSAMIGGAYSLTGGFWSLISVVQTAGTPILAIAHSGESVIIWWPNTGTYSLQQSSSLGAPAGWSTSDYTITTANGTNSITINQPSGNLFFRLAYP
jgi:hypothetical protein